MTTRQAKTTAQAKTNAEVKTPSYPVAVLVSALPSACELAEDELLGQRIDHTATR